jgi:hypothetical protein
MKRLALLALATFALLPAAAQAASVISNTVFVPLHYTLIGSGAYKLGIYASIGGGTPQIFEFDTGGSGFYAAYASNNTNNSAWWGPNFGTTGQPVTNTYDSGIRYEGEVVTSSVALFADRHSTIPLVTTASGLRVGQMTSISNINGGSALWTTNGVGPSGKPPIDDAFYGDFGMSLTYASNGIVNLVAQLSFTNGIIPGFRVRGHSNGPFLQIGLTAADTNSASAFYFGMNTNTNAPAGATFTNSGSRFYSEQVFNAKMTISNSTTNFTGDLGITTDTGASTTIHNANVGNVPGELLITNDKGKVHLVEGASFGLSGDPFGGTETNFYQFVTEKNQVTIQNNMPGNSNIFYLNTGIALFQQYDVIYNLDNGQIGFEPIPEPSTWALLGLGALLLFAVSRKNILNKRKRS